MTVRQLFNEVDEIQCEAIIQQYDYEKNDYEFRVCLSELYSGLDEYERVMDRRVKYIFADMEETDSVFKTKQPVLIIEVEVCPSRFRGQ